MSCHLNALIVLSQLKSGLFLSLKLLPIQLKLKQTSLALAEMSGHMVFC